MSTAPVNVASVPQRSPFRYPGGKTWLIPQLRAWLTSLGNRPDLLIEPFAGGGSVSLTAAAEGLAARVLMGELDPNVAAVWTVLIDGDAETLARTIESFHLCETTVRAALAEPPQSDVDRAFQTILRNRVHRGGIMASRAGLMRRGERGKGLGSRWYPETLARRIRAIQSYRDRIDFVCADGLEVMSQYAEESGAVIFVDPPYTAGGKRAGSRLYDLCDLDHDRLFALCDEHRGDVLLTYDRAEAVLALAAKHHFVTRPIAMRSTHNAAVKELLIGRTLDWVAGTAADRAAHPTGGTTTAVVLVCGRRWPRPRRSRHVGGAVRVTQSPGGRRRRSTVRHGRLRPAAGVPDPYASGLVPHLHRRDL